MLLGIYNYTVLMTYLGMLAGYTGITLTLHGNLHGAMVCLMIAGVCDMFDGRIAATKERTVAEKRFGIQIDSLSDLICFCALPAVLIYMVCAGSNVSYYVSGFYLLCGLIRLAWFNVDEEQRQNTSEGGREFYSGLPVTTVALILPALAALCHETPLSMRIVGPWALILMGVAFLTPFRLRKPALAGKIGILFCGTAELVLILLGGMDL